MGIAIPTRTNCVDQKLSGTTVCGTAIAKLVINKRKKKVMKNLFNQIKKAFSKENQVTILSPEQVKDLIQKTDFSTLKETTKKVELPKVQKATPKKKPATSTAKKPVAKKPTAPTAKKPAPKKNSK